MRGPLFAVLLVLAQSGWAGGPSYPEPGPRDLCPVCGMVVSKYPAWIATVVYKIGRASCRERV